MKIGDLYIGQSTKVVWKIIGLTDKFVWVCLDKDDNQTAIRDRDTFNLGYKLYTPPRSTKTWWIPIVSLKINGTITPWWDGATCSETKPNHKVVYNFDIVRHVFVDWVEFKYTEKEKTND